MKKTFTRRVVIHPWIFLAFCITSITYASDCDTVYPTCSYPQDLINVYEALNDIDPGGTIHLAAGFFYFDWEGIQIYKSCTLEGEVNADGNLLTYIWGGSYWKDNPTLNIASGGVRVKNLIILNTYYYGGAIKLSTVSGGPVIIENNNIICNFKYGIVSCDNFECECNIISNEEITILNNHISSQRGIQLWWINCPVNIIGNTIDNIYDVYNPQWYGYTAGIDLSSLNENPPVNISNNIISLKDGATLGIRVGNSSWGLFNCTVKNNIIKSFEGTTAFEGIGCYPMAENNSIINNDLSGLSTWGHQVGMSGRNNLLQGNVFGFANGDPPPIDWNVPPTALSIVSMYPHGNADSTARGAHTEYNTITDNDYRNCGLLGWEDGENGDIEGGCILVHTIPEGQLGPGPPDEVRFNYVHETGRFPEGTGGPKTQILVLKSTNADGTQLVHDNRIIGLSADELVRYKNNSNLKSTIVGSSAKDIVRENSSETDYLIHLYPNPTKDIVNIEIENSNNATIEIYNISGRLVFSKTVNSKVERIAVSGLSEGTYFVKVRQENNVSIEKLIVY